MADTKSKILQLWSDNLMDRIQSEMSIQQISPFNPKYKGDGILQKTIDYKIYNAAGGNAEKIVFFYEYISMFVETGTGNGQEYDASKLNAPFKSGSKYYKSKHGEREPKPFITPLIKQRSFALGAIAARTLAEEISAKILYDFSVMDDAKKKTRVKKAKTQWWITYARAKGR